MLATTTMKNLENEKNMTNYTPDKFIVVKLTAPEPYPTDHYRVFACWYGGYAGSDSWKLNSGITEVTRDGDLLHFKGSSGSIYTCHVETYGTSGYGHGVLQNLIEQQAARGVTIEVLPEDTDFLGLNYD